jgi:hypothetical protein
VTGNVENLLGIHVFWTARVSRASRGDARGPEEQINDE